MPRRESSFDDNFANAFCWQTLPGASFCHPACMVSCCTESSAPAIGCVEEKMPLLNLETRPPAPAVDARCRLCAALCYCPESVIVDDRDPKPLLELAAIRVRSGSGVERGDR